MPRRTDRMYYYNNNTVMKKGFYSSEYHFGDFLFGMERVYMGPCIKDVRTEGGRGG